MVLSFISKEKSGLRLSKSEDSSEKVHNKVISSFQLSFHDGFGIIDWIFTFGVNVKVSQESNVSSSVSGQFGL